MKKEFKYFVLTEYEQEEIYLREKHKQGYKLVRVSIPGFYYFEKCQPEDVIYKLDFNPQTDLDKESYIQMFEDYGWEYIQDMNEYSYFRKKASETNEEENDIFNDDESRLMMLKKIITKKFVPVLAIFLCTYPTLLTGVLHDMHSPAGNLLELFIFILLVFYFYIVFKVALGYRYLKNKYKNH